MSNQRTIPKFGSFKPKASTEEFLKDPKTPQESQHSGHGRHSKPEHREHKHHHRQHRPRSQEKPDRQLVDTKLPTSTVEQDSTYLFVEDRRGDPQNLLYGSIHRYSVPAFHRIGSGNVLGARKQLKVERNSSDDKGIVLSDTRQETRTQREKYAFSRNEKKAPRLLKVRPDVADHESTAGNIDFIPLRNVKVGEPALLRYDSHHSSDQDDQDYRSIEGKAKVGVEPLDEDLVWASDLDSSDHESGRIIIFDETVRKKNIILSREVDKHPQSVEAWIALIDHQDSLLGLADEGRRKVTNAEKRSMADIKVHMYEKALEKSGTTLKKREHLLVGLMTEGAKIWDFKTQMEKWEQISQENLNSIVLWKRYLDFRQCAFTQFRQEELGGVYMKRIKLLNQAITDRVNFGHGDDEVYEHLIYIVLRATLSLRESGYTELAIAIWQALLEFNLFSPDLPASPQSRFELFQEFWDSEVPRIGEEGAKGWLNSKTDTVPDPEVDEETPAEYLESNDIFDGWVMAEKLKTVQSQMPARTLDDTTEDDPYRVVLWSDIRDFMVDLSYSTSRMTTNRLLLDAFLIFCRLPPIPESHGFPSRSWWIDSFARGELIDCSKSWAEEHFMDVVALDASPQQSLVDPEKNKNDSNKSHTFQWPFQYIAGSPDTMFMSKWWANYFLPWKNVSVCSSHTPANPEGPISYRWMRSALKSVMNMNIVNEFAEYYLAFEACNEPNGVRKVAKSLLKQNAQNLRLYNAYAMIEWSRGNKEISTNVIIAALGIPASLSENERRGSTLLWKSWTWALLDDGDKAGALRCLLSIADGEVAEMPRIDLSSPAIQLKAEEYLSSNRDYMLSSGDLLHGVIYMECLALVKYLTSGSGTETSSYGQGDIVSALAVFEKFSVTLMARNYGSSMSHELALQSAARLLSHHARSGPFRPALIRAHLSRSLDLFPQNTLFLSFYAWNESRLRIDDRVRNILRSVVLGESNRDNIISRLFAIRYEMQAGNVHSTIAAFENAVSSPACKSSPGLWRLYMLYCLSKKQLLGARAKEIFYRALTACPWAKDVFMMAFTDLKELMNMEDLASIYRVMGEKELRILVDVDQRLADLKDGGST